VANGVRVGKISVPPAQVSNTGSVTGGTLQGTFYVQEPNSNQYFNTGEFTATVGTDTSASFDTNNTSALGASSLTPGFQNSLTFVSSVILPPISSHSGVIGISPSIFSLRGLSGSQRALANAVSHLTARSVSLGQQIGLAERLNTLPSSSTTINLLGGTFTGTIYRNTLGSPSYFANNQVFNSTTDLFAFGNSPLNTANLNSTITINNPTNYLVYSTGVSKAITDGQILFPMFGISQRNGAVFTMGSNPANNLPAGSGPLSSLSSFLFF